MEIPGFLSHLRTFNGFPVPFMQAWIDGKPDFRAVNPAKTMQCVQEKLCAICGRRLGEKSCFIGGPLSKANRLFTDPPMHKQCAEFAGQTCPFVSGKKLDYSDRPVNPVMVKVPGDGFDGSASIDVHFDWVDKENSACAAQRQRVYPGRGVDWNADYFGLGSLRKALMD